MSSEKILIVNNLEKSLKGTKIIHNLSFCVQKGQIFGFLGPNGSGKTTTIRMMTGMIKPSSGFVEIMGYNVQNNFHKAMQHLSAIVENPALFEYMTGWKNLKQTARASGKKVDLNHIKWCVETVELTDRIHDKVGNYSLGMKQRLAIAQSLITSPKLLILDEPTNGMDPSGIRDMRALIEKLSKDYGITIFISSHLLSEIENLCDHILIINKGKYVVSGAVKDLVKYNNTLEFNLDVEDSQFDKAYELIKMREAKVFKGENNLIVHSTKENMPHLINYLYQNNIYVYLISRKEKSLEDYFLSVTRGVM